MVPFMDRPAFAAGLRALINAAMEEGVLHFGHAFDDAGRALESGVAEKDEASTVSRFLRKYRHTDRA